MFYEALFRYEMIGNVCNVDGRGRSDKKLLEFMIPDLYLVLVHRRLQGVFAFVLGFLGCI
jgi:hypothetical protein